MIENAICILLLAISFFLFLPFLKELNSQKVIHKTINPTTLPAALFPHGP